MNLKKILPRTLFGRSLLILVIPVLLIQIIATFTFFDRHWSKMTTRLAYAVAGEIAVVANALSHDPEPRRVERIMDYARDHLDLYITYEPNGILSDTADPNSIYVWRSVVAQKLRHELSLQLNQPFTLDLDFEEKWIYVSVQLDTGVLRITLPQRRLFSSSGYIFLLWVFGASTILLVIAVIFMRNQVRPIRKLAAAAELFGKGRDAASFKPEGAREVRQAGLAFMDMRARIKRQIEQRTVMLAGVSHDLRTPLTRLKLQLSMMPQSDDIRLMKDDVAVMENMIQGYLDFVRGDEQEEFKGLNLSEFVQKILDQSVHRDLKIHHEPQTGILLTIKPVSFERALNNLLNNAAIYATNLWISYHKDGEYIRFDFDDDGPGIPEDKFEAVFRPFYRVDDSRNSETGGVGLGLSIVMDIVHAHGGQIWLEKSPRGGLKVVIRLPR